MVQAALEDWRTAPVDERLRAMLGVVEKATLAPESLGGEDFAPLWRQGVSRQAVDDALHIVFAFNVMTRLADSMGWAIPDEAQTRVMAKVLLQRGYA